MSPRPRTSARAQRGFTLIELLTVIAIIGILAAILIPTVGKVRESARVSQTISNLKQIGIGVALYAADNKGLLPAANSIDNVPDSSTAQFWTVGLTPYVGPRPPALNNSYIAKFFQCPVYRSIIGDEPVGWRGGYSMNTRLMFVEPGAFVYARNNSQDFRLQLTRFSRPSQTIFATFGFWEGFTPDNNGIVAPDRFYQTASGANTNLVPHNLRIGAGGDGMGGTSAAYLFLDGSVRNLRPEQAASLLKRMF